eukprot:TRINITY_DN47831_c0_g2_i1.p1 TRINITY_DN47831_c0_g2~~TRINITY_DN47831_c0_g2_i1.p1  ORF type:complete len:514 (-),score=85.11 TRINITY_DN47831_c0_g2_i1:401-1942(-)
MAACDGAHAAASWGLASPLLRGNEQAVQFEESYWTTRSGDGGKVRDRGMSRESSVFSNCPHEESYWTTRTASKSDNNLADMGVASMPVECAADGQSSLTGSITSLIATCIGTGVLALPFAFEAAGPGLGGIILLVSVLLSGLSSHLLVKCCDWVGVFSYEEIMIAAFGRCGSVLMETTVLWLLLGAMTSLLVVTGDALELAFVAGAGGTDHELAWWQSRSKLLAFDVIFVVLPLSWGQSPHSLRYSNSMAVTCTSLTALLIVASGIASVDGLTLLLEGPLYQCGLTSVQAAPIIMLSLGCQVQVPCVYGDLKDRSSKRMTWGLVIVGACCFFIYSAVSILGIAAVKPNALAAVPGNILDGFPGGRPDALLMRGLQGVAVTLVYPMLLLPCRSTLDHLLFGGGASLVQPVVPCIMRLRHGMETLTIIGITFWLATCNTDLASVFGFTGATAGSLICYMLPPLAYLKLRRMRPRDELAGSSMMAAASWAAVVFTIPVMGAALWFNYEKYQSGAEG